MSFPTPNPKEKTRKAIENETGEALRNVQLLLNSIRNPAEFDTKLVSDAMGKPPGAKEVASFSDLVEAFARYAFEDEVDSETLKYLVSDNYPMIVASVVEACVAAADLNSTDYPRIAAASLHGIFARDKIKRYLDPDYHSFDYLYNGLFQGTIPGATLKGLSTYEISLLGGVTVQAVRNAQARNSSCLPKTLDGERTVAPSDVVIWLKSKKGAVVLKKSTSDSEIEVPVAKDGSCFSGRTCERRSGFQVGYPPHEIYYPTFDRALSELKKIEASGGPVHFRRPNHQGIFGRVRAVRWEPRPKSEVLPD